ncbi:hypothetical protein F5Y12DRAFT_711066 [Xylaria sp. FL1777]|nr:hypothetical protein F5Y12DRAFT_711066 [Xylaria sp. FL1777]
MAFLSQPQSPVLHSWTTPGHYFHCKICRDYRASQAREAELEANRVGLLWAIGAGETHRNRILSISSRLQNPRMRAISRQQEGHGVSQTRRVTIQVPCLRHPVRPNQKLGLSKGAPSDVFSPDSPSRKRPVTCTSTPEPAQFLVPGQYPDSDHQPNTQAATDFWTANAELIRQGALERAALERAQASTRTESSPTPTVTNNYLSMPGAWPSWADDPDGIPPPAFEPAPAPVPPPFYVERNNPVNLPSPTRGFFTFFGGLSAFVLSTIRAVRWGPAEPQDATTTPPATSTATQTTEDHPLHAAKRPRFDTGPTRANFTLSGPSRSLPNINEAPTPYRVFNRNQTDPNFNHAGHFSLDAMYDASDSEDDEDDYPGSPMDIDSPQPIVSHETEAILAGQSIKPGHTQSILKSDEHAPIALNMTEAILAQQRTDTESPPKLNSITAAARRAVNMFPRHSAVSKAPATPFRKGNVSLQTRLPEDPLPVAPGIERLRRKDTAVLTFTDAHVSPKAEKALYDNVLEFFPNDVVHSLPGLEDEDLPADALKVEHLKRELMERLRQEEIESQNAALTHLGVRRPNSTLIREPSPEWVIRALDAPKNGTFDPKAVHPDAIELKPRDFAKLVPPTAWLNDDCVHSTLCCLAAYVNKKAGVKLKVDPPKCVAVSSLYWNAFCGDYKKLYPRPFSRKWNMTPANFFNIDTVLIPVNLNSHWTLIVIRPSRRTVSYMDSFHNRNETQLRHAYQWLKLFLGDKFVADEWDTQEFGAPRQTNAWDCGMFVITNAMCLALGLSPMCYDEDKMPIQRRRIAAMLLNGGFHGEFDLGEL